MLTTGPGFLAGPLLAPAYPLDDSPVRPPVRPSEEEGGREANAKRRRMCRNRRLSFGGGGGLRRASKREAGDLPQVLCEEGRKRRETSIIHT